MMIITMNKITVFNQVMFEGEVKHLSFFPLFWHFLKYGFILAI